jgi:hypothetical protein
MKDLSVLAIGIVVFTSGCSTMGDSTKGGGTTPSSTQPPPITNTLHQDTIPGKIVLLPPTASDNYDNLISRAPEYKDISARNLVLAECNAPPPPPGKVLAIFGVVISAAFDYVVNWAGQELQDAMKAYTSGYEVSASGHFYTYQAPKQGTVPELGPNIQCIRVVQLTKDGKTADVDFVGEVRISENKEYFQIRPLSLYFGSAKAKGDSVTLSMELSIDSVWFDRNRGWDAKTLDAIIFSEKFPRSKIGDGSVRYFFDASSTSKKFLGWDNFAKLPLPPISIDRKGSLIAEAVGQTDLAGSVSVKATLSEVGNMPKWLTTLAGVFKTEGSTISKGLTSAVDTELGIKPSTSGQSGN